ncbi:MAG TPA: cyclodeaminase/cyclohydrolase family protein [Gaiellales bacterium]|nr:cyclodeaminase/cyclohydrolase family protein [Gaiellales bacterium]
MAADDLSALPFDGLLDELASQSPAPAGGSAAAVAVAMAAALVEMVARRSSDWEDGVGVAAQARSIRHRIVPLVQADADAYSASLAAMAAAEETPAEGRDEAIAAALACAADVALEIARAGTDAAFLAELVADRGDPSGRDDAQAAAVLAEAGTRVAAALVAANLMTCDGDDRGSAAATCARSAALVRSRMGE